MTDEAQTPAFDALEAAVKEIRAALDEAKYASQRGSRAANDIKALEATRRWASGSEPSEWQRRGMEAMHSARDQSAEELATAVRRSALACAASNMHKTRVNLTWLAGVAAVEIGGRAGFILNQLRGEKSDG